MEEAESITKTTTVASASRRLRMPPLTVAAEDTLRQIAQKVVDHLDTHILSVVDAEGKLVGVVPIENLLDDIFLHVMPEEFLAEVVDPALVAQLARRSQAKLARDLMQKPVYVKMEATIQEAFTKMHENHLRGLPIVDDQLKVIGYLDMLELLYVWVMAQGE